MGISRISLTSPVSRKAWADKANPMDPPEVIDGVRCGMKAYFNGEAHTIAGTRTDPDMDSLYLDLLADDQSHVWRNVPGDMVTVPTQTTANMMWAEGLDEAKRRGRSELMHPDRYDAHGRIKGKTPDFELSNSVAPHEKHLKVGSKVFYAGQPATVVGFRPGTWGRVTVLKVGGTWGGSELETSTGLDPMFSYESSDYGRAYLGEAVEIDQAVKDEMRKLAEVLHAMLKRAGFKPGRVTEGKTRASFNVSAKNIPDAPTNLVAMVTKVMDPVVAFAKSKGADVSTQTLPGGTRYMTMPSGIRIIGGTDTPKFVSVSVVPPIHGWKPKASESSFSAGDPLFEAVVGTFLGESDGAESARRALGWDPRDALDERQKVAGYLGLSGEKSTRQGSFKVSDEFLQWAKKEELGGPHMILFQQVRDHINAIPRESLPAIWGLDNIPDAQDEISRHPRKAFQAFLRNVHAVDQRLGGYLRKVAENVRLVWYMVMERIVGKMSADDIFGRYFTTKDYYAPRRK